MLQGSMCQLQWEPKEGDHRVAAALVYRGVTVPKLPGCLSPEVCLLLLLLSQVNRNVVKAYELSLAIM